MSRITEALGAAKTLLLTLNPSPEPAPFGAWLYPEEWRNAKPTKVPFFLIYDELAIRERGSFGAGRSKHRWTAVFDLLLMPGPLTTDDQLAEAKSKIYAWEEAMETLLFANGTLLGTADIIGEGAPVSRLYTYHPRTMRYFEQLFWGIRFKVSVLQTNPRIMKAQ